MAVCCVSYPDSLRNLHLWANTAHVCIDFRGLKATEKTHARCKLVCIRLFVCSGVVYYRSGASTFDRMPAACDSVLFARLSCNSAGAMNIQMRVVSVFLYYSSQEVGLFFVFFFLGIGSMSEWPRYSAV